MKKQMPNDDTDELEFARDLASDRLEDAKAVEEEEAERVRATEHGTGTTQRRSHKKRKSTAVDATKPADRTPVFPDVGEECHFLVCSHNQALNMPGRCDACETAYQQVLMCTTRVHN